MDDLLTTKHVQDLLKVDRITIYRMLNDGRLKGVKIGSQWRFPINEIERLLNGSQPASAGNFPIHCAQTIQDLFSNISGLGGIVLDNQGAPLTEMSGHCRFCTLVQADRAGMAACRESWRKSADTRTPDVFECHAGLHYKRAPIQDNGQQIGWFLIGGFYWQTSRSDDAAVTRISEAYRIPKNELQAAVRDIPVFSETDRIHLENWPYQVSAAIESILHERAGFMQRLQSIAKMTQLES